MADPVTLKRIEETAAALQVCGVVTLEDLRISIGQDVDQGAASAKYADGILQLTLPKKATAATKKLTVQ